MNERATATSAALILAGLATVLVWRAFADVTPSVPRKVPPAQQAAVIERGVWVIPPGRESVAMRVLAPALEGGVSGWPVESVQLRGSEVHATLEGGGALLLRADGVASPRAVVEVRDVAADRVVQDALEASDVSQLFVRRDTPPAQRSGAQRMTEPERSEDAPARRTRGGGLLDPASRLTGLTPAWLLLLALGFGALFARASARGSSAAAATERLPVWELAALAVATGLRIVMAAQAPIETDEFRPLTSGLALFSDGHDAWLHPPLFRAFAMGWVDSIAWRPGGSALLLRAPSVVASAVGLGFLWLAARRVGSGPWARLALIPVFVAPTFVGVSVLARPYAFVVLFAGVAFWAASAPRVTRTRATLALVAVGLAAWTDVVSGAVLALPVLFWLAGPAAGRGRRLVLAAMALALFVAPLVPGVVQAAAHPVLPGHWNASVADAQAAGAGMAAGGLHWLIARVSAFGVFGLASGGLAAGGLASGGLAAGGLGVLGAALLVAAITSLVRRRAYGLALAATCALLLVLAVGTVRSVRPRNLVALPPLIMLLLSAAAPPRAAADEEQRSEGEPR